MIKRWTITVMILLQIKKNINFFFFLLLKKTLFCYAKDHILPQPAALDPEFFNDAQKPLLIATTTPIRSRKGKRDGDLIKGRHFELKD